MMLFGLVVETHIEMMKQFYFKQFNLAEHNKVKWFQALI